jgi:excisionase family DNA binding protein
MTPIVYNISEACEAGRTGRTALYDAIRKGELRAVKRGRRTLILADDLRKWLENLPAVKPGQEPTRLAQRDSDRPWDG